MKILLATFWVTPHVGGVWNYMQQLKEKLETLGHEVDFLSYGENHEYVHIINENRRIDMDSLPQEVLMEQQDSSLHSDPVIAYYASKCDFFQFAANNLGLEKYDVIHTQDIFSTVCINRIRTEKTALVATLHGCVAHELRSAYYSSNTQKKSYAKQGCDYFNRLEYEGATSADYTIVANEWMRNILTDEFQVPKEQLSVFHYGYDIESFLKRTNEKTEIQRPTDKKVIIYTGRLNEFKGVHHLISALKELKKTRGDWVCWIVGDGPKELELKNKSKAEGLESDVIFMGRRDDVPFLLSLSDIFVLPTLMENQPLSVIEAQITGKAVIASDVGGVPEIIEHGITGVLSPAGDEQMLTMHINYLLENESYMKTLGLNAQKWGLEHWSPDKAVQKVLGVYENALCKKRNK
ncbi:MULTISPECIES: glycosyltransferase family 4 protein [Peribacillus]|uniref:glycosyltransferase family 4 protein n=1 Tax=Peribacillus TaxID=2675229 RepID=UPI001D950568|nr:MULTISPECIES: glycosyltransferase family 4 protein [Peribacillus]MCT4477981.1 glycosyltransferase family 4 protein [Peribacillus frigoritolerans]CAH0131858.1 N-acetyl-alpha-D-glucosaminyl L-malate synthase [Peribacillus sp. Bi134]